MKFSPSRCVSLSILASILSFPAWSEVQGDKLCPTSDLELASNTPLGPAPVALQKPDEIIVTSQFADMQRQRSTEFSGNVVIYQQNNTVQADSALFDEETSLFVAQGNIKLSSESATVHGDRVVIDELNKNFQLADANYQFKFNQGRGSSEQFIINNNQELLLTEATFSTCPNPETGWLISADEITINREDGWGEATGTVFKLADVPVLYLPYLTFPVTEQRKTGLLFPDIGNSSRFGAYYSQPIYLNLAPNYDATLTPEYMDKRGLLGRLNFRHLSRSSVNQFEFAYLGNDQALETSESRYLSYWQHQSSLSANWDINLNWTELADDAFIRDFGSDYHHEADTYLNNFVAAHFQSEGLQLTLLSQEINELGNHSPSYSLPGQLAFDWQAFGNIDDVFQVSLAGQLSHFEHDSADISRVNRVHLAPTAGLYFHQPGYQFSVSHSYLATYYDQFSEQQNASSYITREINKTRVLAGLTFEKQDQFFGNSVTQLLEPKIQYLYVNQVNQDDIGLYDTQLLKNDYYSLFRDTDYSGLDRINATNQVTLGVSTTLLDANNAELLRVGIAQVFDVDQSGTNGNLLSSNPSFALEWFGQISQRWQLEGAALYNREQNELESGFVSLDYWQSNDNNIQINHRFAKDIAGIEISQAGLFASHKINERWSVAVSYQYDLDNQQQLDGLFGVEYRSCCWSVQLSVQRQAVVNLEDNVDNELDYDNNIGFKFTMSGLGGDLGSTITRMFDKSIFAYRRPYLINN